MAYEIMFTYSPKTGELSSQHENLIMGIGHISKTLRILYANWKTRWLYYPTNAHNVKNAELLKHIKIMKVAPTCFGLQRNHNQGATASV